MNEIEKGQLASTTVQCITTGEGSLHNIPKLIKRVIEERVWERRFHYGRVIELKNMRELVTKKPIEGWGQDPKKVEALLKDDPIVLLMWREAMKEQGKRNDLHDNIMEVETQGTSRAYTLSRLRKQHPELYAEVCAGAMSANAAAIKAGFRKVPTPFEQISRLIEKLSPDEREVVRLRYFND
jgi:hypothetical protein